MIALAILAALMAIAGALALGWNSAGPEWTDANGWNGWNTGPTFGEDDCASERRGR